MFGWETMDVVIVKIVRGNEVNETVVGSRRGILRYVVVVVSEEGPLSRCWLGAVARSN